LVSVTKKPIYDVDVVEKILTTHVKSTALPVDSVDQLRSDPTTGRIRNLMVTG